MKMSTTAEVFDIMNKAVVAAGGSLVQKVNGTIKFNVAGAGMWLIDLKSPSGGSVMKSSESDKADLTVSISQNDFIDLINEKLNPQQAFMKGKIKIKGNMALAMKLSSVTSATKAYLQKNPSSVSTSAPANPSSGGSNSSSGLKSAVFFDQIRDAIKADGASFVKKVNGVIQFNVTPGGAYNLDLRNGNGLFTTGTKPADITITISDDDFVAVAQGKLNAQQAFMKGKLKVKGNMALAMKLNVVMDAAKPKSKL